MLDKAGSEHTAVEAVLLRRAKDGLEEFIQTLSVTMTGSEVTSSEKSKAHARVVQRETRERHLKDLATGISQ